MFQASGSGVINQLAAAGIAVVDLQVIAKGEGPIGIWLNSACLSIGGIRTGRRYATGRQIVLKADACQLHVARFAPVVYRSAGSRIGHIAGNPAAVQLHINDATGGRNGAAQRTAAVVADLAAVHNEGAGQFLIAGVGRNANGAAGITGLIVHQLAAVHGHFAAVVNVHGAALALEMVVVPHDRTILDGQLTGTCHI